MIEITTKELIEEYEKIMNITLSKRERIIFLYARIVDFIMEKDVEICETRLGSAIRSFLKTGKRPDHIVINISIDDFLGLFSDSAEIRQKTQRWFQMAVLPAFDLNAPDNKLTLNIELRKK